MTVLLRLYLKLDSQALTLCVQMPVLIFTLDGHTVCQQDKFKLPGIPHVIQSICWSATKKLHKQLRKVSRIGTVRYHWPMSAHASQAFSIASCTDSEDLPQLHPGSGNLISLHNQCDDNLC